MVRSADDPATPADGSGAAAPADESGAAASSDESDGATAARPSAPFVAHLPPSMRTPITRGAVALVVTVGLFASAMVLSEALVGAFSAVVTMGEPGSLSRLFVNTAALQVLGFGVPAAAYLLAHRQRWRSYLRLRECTQWTVFYGTAVGLGLMLVTVAATVLFNLLDIAPAESAAGQAPDPLFYLVLFVVSSLVAVPMEELFFRGLLQRRLTDGSHAILGIAVPSVLFASIHSTVSVGSGGEALALGMFVTFGLVLGFAYHYTENLFVPIIGHVTFNGVQILVRALEVAA